MTDKFKAVILMLISALSFAFMGAMVKLAGDLPVIEKVFFRNLISLIVAFTLIKKARVSLFGSKKNQKYLLLRSCLGLSGVIFYFIAISRLSLADSSMLNKLSPFFVTIFAGFFLKEKLLKVHVPVLIIVFLASLLIIKPKFDLAVLPALSGFLSAMAAGAAYTVVRFLGSREKPATIVFYFSFISVVGLLPFLIFKFEQPSFSQWFYLLGTGLFAASGQISLTYAYKLAPAVDIAVYNYTNVIFSAIIGFFIFQEISDLWSIIGIMIIISASVYLYLYQRKRRLTAVKKS